MSTSSAGMIMLVLLLLTRTLSLLLVLREIALTAAAMESEERTLSWSRVTSDALERVEEIVDRVRAVAKTW